MGALAVACSQASGSGSLLVRVLAPADVTRITVTIHPANLVRELSAAEYDETAGAFTVVLDVPAGAQTVSASAYAGMVLVGTASAPVTVTAGATATVPLTIFDSRPPGPDRAPIIVAFLVPVTTLAVGASTAVSAAATDPDGDPIVFTWTAAPAGCGRFADGSAASTSFTAQAIGPCTVALTASANGKADTESIDLTIVMRPEVSSMRVDTTLGTCTVDRGSPERVCPAAAVSGTHCTVHVEWRTAPYSIAVTLADSCGGSTEPTSLLPGAETTTQVFSWAPSAPGGARSACAVTATLSATGLPGGATLVDTMAIAVEVIPPNRAPIASIISPSEATTSIVAGGAVTFAGSCSDPDDNLPVTHSWNFGGGAPASTAQNPGAVTFSSAGTFTVTYSCTDSLGLASAPISRTVIVTAAEFTIGGSLTYDKVPPSASGLDYAATVTMPIRGATVELMSDASVLATTASDDAGAYSFSWKGPRLVRVRVKALTSGPVIRVEDNTSGNALYAMISPEVDGAATTSLDLHAPSGWGGTSYTGPRVAAPFAILDDAYSAARTFLAERTVPFPELRINWSVNNRPQAGDKALGQITTTHWDGSELYILGLADGDTDEFDSHVIVHEWAHYFESKLGRADSPGGFHGFGDLEDPRLAWSEGWASALGAIVFYPDDRYADTMGPQQHTTALWVSAEDNGDADPNPGWFSEGSMMHVVYDLWDPASGAEPFDTVSFSAGALYDVMTGFQKNTGAFTTVFSFVTGLLAAAPSSAAAVDALLAHRGVAAPIRNEFALGAETNDGGIAGALPVYHFLAVNGPAITVTFTPDAHVYNSLGQNRLAAFEGDGSSVTLSASNADGKPILLRLYEKGVQRAIAQSGTGTPAKITAFQTAAGTGYTAVVTGGDTAGPGTYTAMVRLTSP